MHRLVPELEQPDPVRVGDLLAEVHRRLPMVGAVEPVERARIVRQQVVGDRLRRARRADLAGQVPREHEERRDDEQRLDDPLAAAVGERRAGDERDRTREHHQQQRVSPARRQAEPAVPRLEDGEAGRVAVELDVHLVVGPLGHVEDEEGGRHDGEQAEPRSLEEERGADEEDRRDVDQVPLFDEGREHGRDVRGLHGRVPDEPDHARRRDGDERSLGLRPDEPPRPNERCETGDDRQQAEPDRERAHGPQPVVEHPTVIPTKSVAAPTQSQPVQLARRSRQRSPVHQSPAQARTKTAGRTPSSPRTSGATTQANPAATIQREERVASAFTIRKRQSVEYGYASGSGTNIDA